MELHDRSSGQKVRYGKLHARSGNIRIWIVTLWAVHESTRFIAAGSSVCTRASDRRSSELSIGLGMAARLFAIWCNIRIQGQGNIESGEE